MVAVSVEKSNVKTGVIIFAAVIIIGLFWFIFLGKTGDDVSAQSAAGSLKVGTNVGNTAPDFTVVSLDGSSAKLSDYKNNNKPVLIYFFATWCPYCRQDFAELKKAYPSWEDKVDFLAIDLDLTENQNVIANYKETSNYDWDFALGNPEVLQDYKVIATTIKYGVDKNGQIVYKGSGVVSNSDWSNIFASLAGA